MALSPADSFLPFLIDIKPNEPDQSPVLTIDNRTGKDSRTNHFGGINVDVEDGRVLLSGSVGSALEKTLALERARVAGVDSVVVDNLEVSPEYHSQLLRAEELATLTSDEIREAIESTLTYDPRVPESQVEVSVDDGTITLTGSVDNLNAKIAAEQDTLHTPGVKTVNNNIEVEYKVVVRPEIPTTNKAITSRIREAVLRDPYVDQNNIVIHVREGIV